VTPLEHALYYASRGWRVVPIPPGEKYPKGIDNWQDRATTDPARITSYWTKHPDHGVGIATGAESGIFILDIDPRDGGDDSLAVLEERHGPLPDTVEAITGGDGRHIVLRWPETGEIRNAASGVLGVGVDIRGIGGQFVAAPTVHPNGTAYMWEVEHSPFDGVAVADAPAWLLEILQAPLAERKPRRERLTSTSLGEAAPGDIWAASTTWADELERDGAHLHSTHRDKDGTEYELWTRPGKSKEQGASASLYYKGSDVLKLFTPNWTGLLNENTYTLWGYHVATHHGGESPEHFVEAAREHGRQQRAEPSKDADEEPGDSGPTRPTIVHNGRQLDDLTRAAITALERHNAPALMFVRAGQLTRLRQDEEERPIIEGLRTDHIRSALADAALWYRVNKDGEHTSTSPPIDVAVSVLAHHSWPFPPLAGVVELPVLRPDGTFATDHGYDAATRLYHWHRGKPYMDVAVTPTPEEVRTAVALIDEAMCDFPWDTTADRANAWALLITPLVRPLIGQVPMALVDAPEPGTGKGLLVKVAAIITIGRSAALMAWPTSDEELEKKVTAALMAGNTMIIWDNVEGMIKSSTLAAVLTADTWQGRILGRSEMITVPNRATWAATGNNIDVGGDLARRCYRIRLDAHQAQPWKRSGFKHADLEGWVSDNRGQLLHALCTIVRSWWVAGQPLATDLPAMGGYSGWVRTLGGILDHAGVPGFLANLDEFHATADREAAAWETFLTVWHEEFADKPMTVAEVVSRMKDLYAGAALTEALPEDLAEHFGTSGFSKRFGRALRRRAGRHYGEAGLHLVEYPLDRRKVAIYAVMPRGKPAPPTPADQDVSDECGFRGSTSPASQVRKLSTGLENDVSTAEKNPRNPQTRGPLAADTIDDEGLF